MDKVNKCHNQILLYKLEILGGAKLHYYDRLKAKACMLLLGNRTYMRLVYHYIRKTCTCNVYPLEPHFYAAKLGYAGVYLFFLFLLQNIDCGYSSRLF